MKDLKEFIDTSQKQREGGLLDQAKILYQKVSQISKIEDIEKNMEKKFLFLVE